MKMEFKQKLKKLKGNTVNIELVTGVGEMLERFL